MPPVLPVDLTALAAIVMGCLIVLIPIAGLTARFAIKPIAEAMARMRESAGSAEALALLERRTALLEQELQNLGDLRADVARLTEGFEFQRQLDAPRTGNPEKIR